MQFYPLNSTQVPLIDLATPKSLVEPYQFTSSLYRRAKTSIKHSSIRFLRWPQSLEISADNNRGAETDTMSPHDELWLSDVHLKSELECRTRC